MEDKTLYQSITVVFKKEGLCKEENLKEVWKTEVEAVVEAKGLSCELNWDKGEMTVEPIFSGEIYSAVMKVRKPDGTSEVAFSKKYNDFIDKIETKFQLSQKLSCYILYHTAAIVVLSDKLESTCIVRNLVISCLNDDDPFDEDHFDELFLGDVMLRIDED
ncbi:hypothetical protein ACLB2K_070793 [Fragaria x ananassa]